jgi:hypothetical protein
MRKRIGDWYRLMQLIRAGPAGVKKLPSDYDSQQSFENEMLRSLISATNASTGTSTAVSDAQLEETYTEMGNRHLERRNYELAVKYFALGRNLAKQAECVYFLEDYESLSRILEQMPENSEFLPVRNNTKSH